MNKKFLAAGMAAAMAATMLPSMAFADEKPTVTLLVPEYNAGKSLKNEGSAGLCRCDEAAGETGKEDLCPILSGNDGK